MAFRTQFLLLCAITLFGLFASAEQLTITPRDPTIRKASVSPDADTIPRITPRDPIEATPPPVYADVDDKGAATTTRHTRSRPMVGLWQILTPLSDHELAKISDLTVDALSTECATCGMAPINGNNTIGYPVCNVPWLWGSNHVLYVECEESCAWCHTWYIAQIDLNYSIGNLDGQLVPQYQCVVPGTSHTPTSFVLPSGNLPRHAMAA